MRTLIAFILIIASLQLRSQDFFQYPAKLVRVIDGDSYVLKVVVPDWEEGNFSDFKTIEKLVRLKGADCAELNPTKDQVEKSKGNLFYNKHNAERAKYYANLLLDGNTFYIKYSDKYFDTRWVVDVIFEDGKYLKDELIKMGLAIPY